MRTAPDRRAAQWHSKYSDALLIGASKQSQLSVYYFLNDNDELRRLFTGDIWKVDDVSLDHSIHFRRSTVEFLQLERSEQIDKIRKKIHDRQSRLIDSLISGRGSDGSSGPAVSRASSLPPPKSAAKGKLTKDFAYKSHCSDVNLVGPRRSSNRPRLGFTGSYQEPPPLSPSFGRSRSTPSASEASSVDPERPFAEEEQGDSLHRLNGGSRQPMLSPEQNNIQFSYAGQSSSSITRVSTPATEGTTNSSNTTKSINTNTPSLTDSTGRPPSIDLMFQGPDPLKIWNSATSADEVSRDTLFEIKLALCDTHGLKPTALRLSVIKAAMKERIDMGGEVTDCRDTDTWCNFLIEIGKVRRFAAGAGEA